LSLGEPARGEKGCSLAQQWRIATFLSIVLLLYSANNIYYFLFVKGASLLSLLVWNTCTPISLLTVCVLIFGGQRRALSSVMIPLLLWFGFGGFFMFWWGWFNPQLVLFMQGHHLAMTAAALYLAKNRWNRKGVYAGLVVLALYFASFPVLSSYTSQPW